MRRIIASIVIPAAFAATAAARPAHVGDVVTTPLPGTNLVLARKLVAARGTPDAMAQSKIIYLNHTGVTLTPGDDDSRDEQLVDHQSAQPASRRGTRARRTGPRRSRA